MPNSFTPISLENTSFDDVIDLALVTINDYKLIKLYNKNQEEFQTWCDGFLLNAIPNFYQCRNSLEYNLNTREFVSNLTNLEISILADLWVIEWFLKETQDSTKINNLLQTTGSFKSHSASQNLKEKNSFLDGLREKVNQKIIQYQLQDISNIEI